MTCIIEGFKTKKELRDAIKAGVDPSIVDPSIFRPRVFRASEIPNNTSVVVTNHPKRSWFVEICKGRDGKILVK